MSLVLPFRRLQRKIARQQGKLCEMIRDQETSWADIHSTAHLALTTNPWARQNCNSQIAVWSRRQPWAFRRRIISDLEALEIDLVLAIAMSCATKSGKKWAYVTLTQWKGRAEGR
jgi:hypothetical protein